METISTEPIDQFMPPEPKRPDFLKVLCILSFIACGLCILLFAMGTMCLVLDENTINTIWQKMIEKNPIFEDMDGVVFFRHVGLMSMYSLVCNVVSLIGVIMMWNLNRIGFFIYVIAELTAHCFRIEINTAEAATHSGLIFSIFLDLAFIIMYAVNLKYMKKKVA